MWREGSSLCHQTYSEWQADPGNEPLVHLRAKMKTYKTATIYAYMHVCSQFKGVKKNFWIENHPKKKLSHKNLESSHKKVHKAESWSGNIIGVWLWCTVSEYPCALILHSINCTIRAIFSFKITATFRSALWLFKHMDIHSPSGGLSSLGAPGEHWNTPVGSLMALQHIFCFVFLVLLFLNGSVE